MTLLKSTGGEPGPSLTAHAPRQRHQRILNTNTERNSQPALLRLPESPAQETRSLQEVGSRRWVLFMCVPSAASSIQQDVHKCSVQGFLEQQMLPTAGVLQPLGTTHALSPGCGPRPDPHHPGPAQGGKWRGTTDQIATHRNKGDFLLLESNTVTTH